MFVGAISSATTAPAHSHGARTKYPASPADHHRDGERRSDEHHGVLVEEPDPDHRADHQPQPFVIVCEEPHDEPSQDGPCEQVERGRRQANDRRRGRPGIQTRSKRGEESRPPSATEFAGNARGQQHDRPDRQGGKQPETNQVKPPKELAACNTRATVGVNGGWSTYPHARRFPPGRSTARPGAIRSGGSPRPTVRPSQQQPGAVLARTLARPRSTLTGSPPRR